MVLPLSMTFGPSVSPAGTGSDSCRLASRALPYGCHPRSPNGARGIALTPPDERQSSSGGAWIIVPALAVLVAVGIVIGLVAIPAAQDPTIHLVGAGDIAACGSDGSAHTAQLLVEAGGRVFTLGDNAYPDGAPADFACFDQTWGRFKRGMLPAVGNHEYITPGATGYFAYFGSAAGTDGYYALDLGRWRLYV